MIALFLQSLNMDVFYLYCSYKIVDSKGKMPLIRLIWEKNKNVDERYSAPATHLYNIVIFIHDIYIFVFVIWEVFPILCMYIPEKY